MKLNPDCIRDILLVVEKQTDVNNLASFTNREDFEQLPMYSPNEIMYHIRQCDHSGLFLDKVIYVSEGCFVKDLSPKGHEFLADIRQDTNWNRTKDIAKNVGSYSIKALSGIASQVIADVISRQFNQ